MNLNNLISTTMSSEPSNDPKNVLTNEVQIEGTLRFSGELIFDGKIVGHIISNGILTLGKAAHVEGEIKVKSTIIYGCVKGNITVSEKCELKASAQLTGDLKACRILIEEGATFIGKSEVSPTMKPEKNVDLLRNTTNSTIPSISSNTQPSSPETVRKIASSAVTS